MTDVAANSYATYGPLHSNWSDEPGLQRLTAFALFTLVMVPPLRKHLPK